jgi:Flp pilus assembly pilin Flp
MIPMRLRCNRAQEIGASSAEYAILASLIAIVVLSAIAFLGTSLAGSFHRSCDSVAATHSSSC